jgi:hypothetical protein
MVYMPASETAHVETRASAGPSLIERIVGFFSLMGAAIRVARAVESHRNADVADLRVLGITSKLPRSW